MQSATHWTATAGPVDTASLNKTARELRYQQFTVCNPSGLSSYEPTAQCLLACLLMTLCFHGNAVRL
jgi:hypothetical protein